MIKKIWGFSLIELATVLAVVGIVLSLSLKLLGSTVERTQRTATRSLVESSIDGVTGFTANNNQTLPETLADFRSATKSDTDVWNRPLSYIFDTNLNDLLCGATSTNITIKICRDNDGNDGDPCTGTGATAPTTINNIAFMVLSGGANFNTQTANAPNPLSNVVSGITTNTTINTYQLAPSLAPPKIDDYINDVNRPETYDDIIAWVSLTELQQKIACLGTELNIVNNELPSPVNASAVYNAEIVASNGFPSGSNYGWCIEDPSNILDLSGLGGTITVTPNTVSIQSDCSSFAFNPISPSVVLAGNAVADAGSYTLKVFAQDQVGKIVSKTFVITVN